MNTTLQPGQWAWIKRPDYSKGETRSLTYCPECAKAQKEKLEPLWENCVDRRIKRKDVLSECVGCRGQKMQEIERRLSCIVHPGVVEVFRGEQQIATCIIGGQGEPEPIMVWHPHAGTNVLTFNELDIIRDNWNQAEEMLQKRLTSAKELVE